jgi:hypothetical protein
MAKVPGFAKAFAGSWRIVEMDAWTADRLGLQNAVRVLQRPARSRNTSQLHTAVFVQEC